jgi:antitoxin VapB
MTITITSVFINDKDQVVRLVGEARLPEDIKKVAVRIRGRERVITPLENTWDNFFLNGLRVTDDFMNQRGENK